MKWKNEAIDTDLLPDEVIIDLYWGRDESAITATDRKYGKYLYTIAYNIVRDNMDCEECLNDTYLHTWNRIPPSKPTLFQNFLSKIMRDVAIDKYRENTAAKRIPSELMIALDELDECIACDSPEDDLYIKQAIEALNSYLRGLNKRKRLMFVCRYYYADSIDTIAQMLNVSRSTVFRNLASMRQELKKRFEEEEHRL